MTDNQFHARVAYIAQLHQECLQYDDDSDADAYSIARRGQATIECATAIKRLARDLECMDNGSNNSKLNTLDKFVIGFVMLAICVSVLAAFLNLVNK